MGDKGVGGALRTFPGGNGSKPEQALLLGRLLDCSVTPGLRSESSWEPWAGWGPEEKYALSPVQVHAESCSCWLEHGRFAGR